MMFIVRSIQLIVGGLGGQAESGDPGVSHTHCDWCWAWLEVDRFAQIGELGGKDGCRVNRAFGRSLRKNGLLDGRRETSLLLLPLHSTVPVALVCVAHALPLGRVAEGVVDPLGLESLPQEELKDAVLARVVPEKGLLVLPGKLALLVGAGVGPAVGEDLVYPLLEVLHHQVVLLLPVLVLGLGLEATQFASVGCPEAVGILGESLDVQHPSFFSS